MTLRANRVFLTVSPSGLVFPTNNFVSPKVTSWKWGAVPFCILHQAGTHTATPRLAYHAAETEGEIRGKGGKKVNRKKCEEFAEKH